MSTALAEAPPQTALAAEESLVPPPVAELFDSTYESPVAVYRIDACLPDWTDERYGKLISYNSGTPVEVQGKWLMPIRAEFEHDEHYSVILWREWDPAALPELVTTVHEDGTQTQEYVFKLKVYEEDEVWMFGQDPAVWKAKMPEYTDGEAEERLFISYTEVTETWRRSPDPGEPPVRGIQWRNVIKSGTNPRDMEVVYVSAWGHKNQFGVATPDGMVLVTRPQENGLDSSIPEGNLGRLGVVAHVSSMRELRGLSYNPATGQDPVKQYGKVIKEFGDDDVSWVGAKQGEYLGGSFIAIEGAHIATRVALPAGVTVPDHQGIPQSSIRLYCGARAIINFGTGKVMGRQITEAPWDIRRGGEPKRPELTFIAFASGTVPKAARAPLPPGLDETDGPFVQRIASYGDSGLRLVVSRHRGFDSEEVRAEVRAHTAPRHSLGAVMLAEIRAAFPAEENDPVAG